MGSSAVGNWPEKPRNLNLKSGLIFFFFPFEIISHFGACSTKTKKENFKLEVSVRYDRQTLNPSRERWKSEVTSSSQPGLHKTLSKKIKSYFSLT